MKKVPAIFISAFLFAACTQNTKTETAAATETGKAAKYATEIPASITIPDKVETRLGTLTFKDGFPDDATVQKVYDNLDFQRGVQALLTGMPAASLVAGEITEMK